MSGQTLREALDEIKISVRHRSFTADAFRFTGDELIVNEHRVGRVFRSGELSASVAGGRI